MCVADYTRANRRNNSQIKWCLGIGEGYNGKYPNFFQGLLFQLLYLSALLTVISPLAECKLGWAALFFFSLPLSSAGGFTSIPTRKIIQFTKDISRFVKKTGRFTRTPTRTYKRIFEFTYQ